MKRIMEQRRPVKRRDGLIVEDFFGEVLVYDLDRHRAHCLNETAAWVWKHCNGRRSAADLAELLSRKTDQTVDESVVELALEQLDRYRLLERDAKGTVWSAPISRRDLVRRLGVTALVTIPLVTTMAAPVAAQTATCGGVGAPCTTNARCCSGICMNGTCVCLANGTTCTADAQCCSGVCTASPSGGGTKCNK